MPFIRTRPAYVLPPIGPPPAPPIPLSITYAPAAPSIADNTAAGAIVAAISIVMSDGSAFGGVLSFAAPFNNDGGIFGLSSANLVTVGALPVGASIQNVTVSAAQNGTTIKKDLAITVTAHGSGAILTTLGLTSAVGGTALPSIWGIALPKGVTQGPISTDVIESDTVVLRRWNDNTIKHAAIITRPDLTLNTLKSVKVIDAAASTGTPLTSADITAANPAATVAFGSPVNQTVSLSALLASPVRTFISRAQMVECHYQLVVSNLLTSFHVRLFKGGRVWVRAIVENGWATGNSDKTYAVIVTIGGAQVFTNAALAHFQHTRWFASGWIGGNPQITPKHNVTDLISTKLVPNYFGDTPSAAMLNGTDVAAWGDWKATQTYTPMGSADIHKSMGDTGPQDQIGILPLWDSLFVTSNADPRMFNCVVANALAMNSFGIVWRGATDSNLPGRPSIFPTYAFDGSSGQDAVPGGGGGGTQAPTEGILTWDAYHHPSAGFLAYLLTCDYAHLETMQHQPSAIYFNCTSGNGSGVNRNIKSGALRGWGWFTRTCGQMLALAPTTDLVAIDYASLLSNNATINNAIITGTAGLNNLGIIYDYDAVQSPIAPGEISPLFMFFFVVQALGHVSDIEPLANMTTFNAVRDFHYKIPVGLLGTASGADYYYTYAAADFRLNAYSAQPTTDLQTITHPPLDSTWGDVWNRSQGSHTQPGTPLTNTLQGASGSDPATGATSFWANLLPAIAMAVDHGAAGAAACWNRLIGTTNWLTLRNATDVANSSRSFANSPIFGVQPRVSTTDALSALLATMAAGTWKAVPSSNMSAVTYGNNAGDDATLAAAILQNSGPAAIMSAWGGAALDPVTGRLLVCNGGHGDYWGNEFYEFRFSTLKWANLSKPSNPSGVNQSTWLLPDGTPAVPHNYDTLNWDATAGKLMFLGAGQWSPFSGDSTHAFYVTPTTMVRGTTAGTSGTNSWAQIHDAAFGNTQAMLHYDSTSGHMWEWATNQFGIAEYISGSNTWTVHGTQAAGSTFTASQNQCGAIQPGLRALATGSGVTYFYSIASGMAGNLTIQTTTGDKTIENANNPGIVWHPLSSKFVGWNGGQTVYTLNPTSWLWTAVTMTGDVPTAVQTAGTFGRFQYDATHNCLIAVNDITQSVYVGKLPATI